MPCLASANHSMRCSFSFVETADCDSDSCAPAVRGDKRKEPTKADSSYFFFMWIRFVGS